MLAIKSKYYLKEKKGLTTITWLMLSFLLMPWIAVILEVIRFIEAAITTGIVASILVPVYILVQKYKRSLVSHVQLTDKIYTLLDLKTEGISQNGLNDVLLNTLETFLKEKENQVTQSRKYRAQLREILDRLDLGIIVVDQDLTISYINFKAKQLFHIDEDIRHKNVLETEISKDIVAHIKRFNEESNHIYSTEYEKEDRIYLQQTSRVKLYEHSDSVMITFDDITLEKSTDQMKKDFFSYASHELKSPLTSIRGYAELIEHKMISEKEQPEIAKQIVAQANLMSTLVEDMLMLSRLENYKEAKQILVAAHEKLEDVIHTLMPQLLAKNIIIDKDVHMIKMYCDPLDLIKLFKNLIENAIKYSPNNTTISLKLYQQLSQISFTIKDQGYGIPEEDKSRVFERFYRIEKDQIKGGTGLGLAIVKHVVLKYHGTYTLQSEVGKGTTIHINIPNQKSQG